MKTDEVHISTDEQLEALEGRLKREYDQAAKELQRKLDKYLARYTEKDKKKRQDLADGKITEEEYKTWRYGQIMTGKRWRSMQKNLTADLVNVDKVAMRMVNDELPQVYAENTNYGMYEVEKSANVSTSFTLYSKDTVKDLIEAEELILPAPSVNIPKDTRWCRQHIHSAVLQGVLQGESIDKIAKRLQNVSDMNRRAAVRNARTMVTSAENQGRVDSYKRAEKMDIQMEQVWIATLDGRTRHSHRMMDGERAKIGAKFSNGCRYPADPQGRPEEVYNCRCTVIGQVAGIDMKLNNLENRNTDHLGDMTYEEWKNEKAISKRTGESVRNYETRVAKNKRKRQ